MPDFEPCLGKFSQRRCLAQLAKRFSVFLGIFVPLRQN